MEFYFISPFLLWFNSSSTNSTRNTYQCNRYQGVLCSPNWIVVCRCWGNSWWGMFRRCVLLRVTFLLSLRFFVRCLVLKEFCILCTFWFRFRKLVCRVFLVLVGFVCDWIRFGFLFFLSFNSQSFQSQEGQF